MTGKIVKTIGLGLALAAGLLLLIAAAIVLLVDPNDFRDDITEAVQAATGRELVIEGDLELSLFPWLGLSLGEARLGNAPSFVKAGGDKDFARVAKVDIRAKLLPLLQQRLVMKTVHLRGMRVNLQRAADGRNNWDDLLGAPQDDGTRAQAPRESEAPSPGPSLVLAIGGLDISDAQLVWDDRQAGQRIELKRLSLQTGPIAPGSPMDIKLDAQLTVAQPALQTPLALRGRVTAHLPAQTFRLDNLDLALELQGAALPVSPLALHLTGNMSADLASQQAQISQLQLQALGLTLDARARVQLADSQAGGNVSLASFSPRELASRLGIALPETADKNVLNQASANLVFTVSPDAIQLSDIELRVDDSQLNGVLVVEDFSRQALRFDLALDDIDADRYLPPASTIPPPEPAAATAAGVQLPLDLLRGLDIKGDLRLGKLKVAKARVTDVRLGLSARRGVVRLSPLQAKLYQGNFRGNVFLDVRGKTPKISVDEKLQSVHVGPLLQDILGKDNVSGVADISANVTAAGANPDDVIQSLNGTARFSFVDGAVKGVNLGQLIRDAYAKLKKQPAPPKAVKQTDFAELSGSVSIRNGVVHNQDLRASSPALRVAGKGKVDLPRQRIDYLLNTSIVETDQGQGGLDLSELKALTIPIKITGSFENPKLKLDLAPLLKAKAKTRLQKEKARVKSKAKQKLEKKKDEARKKLEDKLQNKLKGLFR